MTIYRVYENSQASDSDAWGHWVDRNDKSFHLTIELAQAAVKKYIQEELDELEQWKTSKFFDLKSYRRQRNYLRLNKTWLTTENNGHGGEWCTLYNIEPIEVEEPSYAMKA